MRRFENVSTVNEFYRCKEWVELMRSIRLERHNLCEFCKKPIVNSYDSIGHHRIPLNIGNFRDANVSLNPDNIMLVHHRCHNLIHNRLGRPQQQVFIVYGSPCSGKSTYVSNNMQVGDLIIDMDSIWQSISGLDRYSKPNQIKPIAFGIRDYLIDCVRTRQGKWATAWVIGGYPYRAERERLARQLNARLIYVDTPKEECLERLFNCDDGRNVDDWKRFIEEYFKNFS